MFAGISKTTIPTLNKPVPVLMISLVNFKSLANDDVSALPMFPLSMFNMKNAKNSNGITVKSAFKKARLSSFLLQSFTTVSLSPESASRTKTFE
ncbi:unnamed protein product [Ambrosiozyma monospora]|uniref:Unnamed protein product n=1 Tax=Ambrosiozyma monospora TaxID=43982 RepID=A0ACB5UB61_AMBMO|nr:unnamed protein product [Ambrosiozyma monospora]